MNPQKPSRHYLVCWNHEYVHDAIRDHKDVIEGRHPAGLSTKEPHRVWWGKFDLEKLRDGHRHLEVWEDPREETSAKKEVRLLNEQLKAGRPVHLYIHDPNPPQTQCHVAHVLRLHYGEASTLPPDGEGRPGCARIPAYYFDEKDELSCNACRKAKGTCRLRYDCRFWFLVDALKPNPRGEFYRQLYDTNTGKKLDFAITLFYPLLVEERPAQDYFDPKRKARLSMEAGAVEVLDKSTEEKVRAEGSVQFQRSFFEHLDDLGRARLLLQAGRLRHAAVYASLAFEAALDRLKGAHPELCRPDENGYEMSNLLVIKNLQRSSVVSKEAADSMRAANVLRKEAFHNGVLPSKPELEDLIRRIAEM